jgi:hypothetical protein
MVSPLPHITQMIDYESVNITTFGNLNPVHAKCFTQTIKNYTQVRLLAQLIMVGN